MNVKVCHGCPLRHVKTDRLGERTRKTRCQILQAKLDGVRGLRLRSIDFNCPTKAALFSPGQQVTFLGNSDEGDEFGRRGLDEFTGWVMGWRGNKVRVVSTETNCPLCSILPERLMLTGEDTRRVCIHCGMPQGVSISIKSSMDDKPRPWICRDKCGDELPCEYDPPESE